MPTPFLLTEVSVLTPLNEPRAGPAFLLKFAHNLSIRHALVVNLSAATSSLTQDARDVYLDFLGRLYDIAQADLTRPETEKIDYVRFESASGSEPSRDVWQMLEALKPVYLEVVCGWEENFEIQHMDALHTKWPLKTLVVGGVAGTDISSPYLETVETLVLDLSCNIRFQRATSRSALRHLVIVENDACSTFSRLHEHGLLADIRTATIRCTNGCDHDFDAGEFLSALRASPLSSLTLWISEKPDAIYGSHEMDELSLVELPRFFPSTLETVHIRMVDFQSGDMSFWAECIQDPEWLPRLKTLSVSFEHKEAADTSRTAAITTGLLDSLAKNRPSVTIAPSLPQVWSVLEY